MTWQKTMSRSERNCVVCGKLFEPTSHWHMHASKCCSEGCLVVHEDRLIEVARLAYRDSSDREVRQRYFSTKSAILRNRARRRQRKWTEQASKRSSTVA